MLFNKDEGSIVGSYWKINYNDIVHEITINMSNDNTDDNNIGRYIRAAIWVDENFDISNLSDETYLKNNTIYHTKILCRNSSVKTPNVNNILYLDTNSIPKGKNVEITFMFDYKQPIPSEKIFFALISDYSDFEDKTLYISTINSPSLYYKPYGLLTSTSLIRNEACCLDIVGYLATHIDGTTDGDNDVDNKDKIRCNKITYRTHSEPYESVNYDEHSKKTYFYSDNVKYLYSQLDGGEDYNTITNVGGICEDTNKTKHSIYGDYKPQVINKSSNTEVFISEYGIPEGRLKDVEFKNPELTSYEKPNVTNSLPQPRWVFKRSRIKFSIPPLKKQDGTIDTTSAVYIRYKVETAVYNKDAYKTSWKQCLYTADLAKNDIDIVICPRDEGVLDNMPFKVIFSRRRKDSKINDWCEDTVYYFHTYQRPVINIAYPKMIRNSATKDKFKWPQIVTSNMYSNFEGENAVVNKYVCDALNVILASSPNDASGIPQFVRFYLAEYKFGRNAGTLSEDGTSYNLNSDDTLQTLYRSPDSKDYATLNEILSDNDDKKTAYLTSIANNDNSSLLFSGRFNNKTLEDIGQNYKLWTYNKWDWVVNENDDITVGNAWLSSSENIATIIPDHATLNINTHDELYFSQSNAVLFRAGYIYLLRVRLFHGAAAGAIGTKYSTLGNANEIIYGNYGSGKYEYPKQGAYTGKYPYETKSDGSVELNDDAQHGNLHLYASKDIDTHGGITYTDWVGPHDGTSGIKLLDKDKQFLNQTYPGFSEVDYTIIEPVCPYVSKSNLITVHPTSSEISANQWITFNYRHLSKNRADIDTWVPKATDVRKSDGNSFGKKNTGIQNTITRIMNMYQSCVYHIIDTFITSLENYNSHLNTNTDSIHSKNFLSIWIDPIENRYGTEYVATSNNYKSRYCVGLKKSYNTPLVFDLNISDTDGIKTNYKENNIFEHNFTHIDTNASKFKACGLYHFYNFDGTNSIKFPDSNDDLGYDTWPENQIVWKQSIIDSIGRTNTPVPEPLGNVYRWQPVINAIGLNEPGDKLIELKIEDEQNDTAKKFIYDNWNNYTAVTSKLQKTIHASSILQVDPFEHDKITNPVHPTYCVDDSQYYDLQTKYAYFDDCSYASEQYPNGLNFENNLTTRFCINEFAGYTLSNEPTIDYDSLSSYPVMYTTVSYNDLSEEYGTFKDFKFFTLNTNNFSNKQYGSLFKRVSTLQDCENGLQLSDTCENIGNLSQCAPLELSDDGVHYKSLNDFQNINVTPLVRTTHYLYFKTHINTSFYCQIHNYKQYEDDEGNWSQWYETKYLFNGNRVTYDSLTFDSKGLYNGSKPESLIKFGDDGISEVYGEDNFGWGRCLSAEDVSARSIDNYGDISDQISPSGGIEVPVLVRYTPLLQPKLISEQGNDKNNNNKKTTLIPGNKHVTLVESSNKKSISVRFADGNSNSNLVNMEMDSYNLNVGYPFIPENNTYNTKSPNGGQNNIYHSNYYFDADSFPSFMVGSSNENTNMDFLGGYGICTAYNVYLVPSDPVYPDSTNVINQFALKHYFNATNGHWNYFKQPANYYKTGKILKDVTSMSVNNARPVLVAYNVQANETLDEYLKDGTFCSDSWVDGNNFVKSMQGRNFQSIPLNFKKLRTGYVYCGDSDGNSYKHIRTNKDYFNTNLSESDINLTNNVLQPGVTYDLVIVPVYSNLVQNSYNYTDGAGTINGLNFGGGVSDKNKNIHYAGSNPLVIYNYLQVSSTVVTSSSSKPGDDTPPPPPEEDDDDEIIIVDHPDETKIMDVDACIMFPNVNNKKYNITNGEIKECPGFWLNNSFKLILRLPAFRKANESYSYLDENTLNNASHGALNDKDHNSDDFKFSDIQIHIGKIEELTLYGYPDKMHLNLNKITNKDELAKLNIFSYSHYANEDVFSKKLSDENEADLRDMLTGGSLHPTDENYKHRFIEINLAKLNITTNYPEGYYIQFRYKSIYSSGEPENDWSPWIGGSNDGGLHWWGDNGTNYYVPIRNYSDVHTDFRNYIKESYPGSMIQTTAVKDNTNVKITHNTTGMGSLMTYGEYDESSNTKPQSAKNESYYMLGIGNQPTTNNWDSKTDTMLVPDFYDTNSNISNSDNCYISQYQLSHDLNFTIPENISNLHQTMWEMLYIDYVLRNMCRLYYKPDYNDISNDDDDRYFTSKYDDTKENAGATIYYHSATPHVDGKSFTLDGFSWGWDNTSFTVGVLNDKDNKTYNKIFTNVGEKINDNDNNRNIPNNRDKLNYNKYYRKPITQQDFEELHSHLVNLTHFIRHTVFTGLTKENEIYITNVLPVHENELTFNGLKKSIIGHDLSGNPGLDRINNINHTMIHSNYIKCIWNEILMMCNSQVENQTHQIIVVN